MQAGLTRQKPYQACHNMKKTLIIILCFIILLIGARTRQRHSELSGLLMDNHPQYMKTDGIRPFAADVNLGGYKFVYTGYDEGELLFANSNGDIISDPNLQWDDVNDILSAPTFTDGTATLSDGEFSTTGKGTFGSMTIFNPSPILIFKDSTSAGIVARGIIEWRDLNHIRLGYFGNSSEGNDDLLWKNESSGGHIQVQTIGAGEFQIFTNTVLNGDADIGGNLITTGRIVKINTTAKTANYTALATDENILCDTSGGAFTILLPASPESGRVHTIILETAGNDLTVSGNGKNIVGAANAILTVANEAVQLIYNGTQWSIK